MAIYSKKLDEIVGAYYNSEASYYEVLRNIMDFPNAHIWNVDTAIDTLKRGIKAVREGKDIAYDGINFIIKEQK